MKSIILLLLLLLSPLLVMAENQAMPISVLVIPLVDPQAPTQPVYQKKDVSKTEKADKFPLVTIAFEAKLYRMLLREYMGAVGSRPIPI
jgi:hypothetical protein